MMIRMLLLPLLLLLLPFMLLLFAAFLRCKILAQHEIQRTCNRLQKASLANGIRAASILALARWAPSDRLTLGLWKKQVQTSESLRPVTLI